MNKTFHSDEFSEGTKIKLEILRLYISGWIPVFLSRKELFWNSIYLYDFFAGSGTDGAGNFGSPLILLNELRKYCQIISDKGVRVTLFLNEYDKNRATLLKGNIEKFIIDCRNKGNYPCCEQCILGKCPINIEIESQEFHESFNNNFVNKILNLEFPRFIFLDQFGVKQITNEVFQQLISLNRADILFFISSSFFRRFAKMPGFNSYLNLTREDFDESRPSDCHRVIYEYYKFLIPANIRFYLAPFSIKKGPNIYGLVFGSHNLRGLEIFLNAAWSIDRNTGEANYNIDNDRIIDSGQLSIFEGENKIRKLNVFEEKLINWLKSGIRSNTVIYQFTLESGFKPQHANSILSNLEREGVLNFQTSFERKRFSYYISYSSEKIIYISYNK
jgi:three-Cys-motif partner protein